MGPLIVTILSADRLATGRQRNDKLIWFRYFDNWANK